MKSEYRLTMEYHINDIEGEANVEDFLDWVFYDVMELRSSPIDVWGEEINNYYKSGNTIGPVSITEYGAYCSVWFKFDLNTQQETDIKGFNKSLDIVVDHLVTKYRLRWALKHYQNFVEVRAGLRKGSYKNYRGAKCEVYHKMIRVYEYLAKRKLRGVAAYKDLE